MKILDRTGLAIFSTIVLIISIVMCMIIFDWVSINTVTGIVSRTLNYGVGSKIVLGISIAFILLAINIVHSNFLANISWVNPENILRFSLIY